MNEEHHYQKGFNEGYIITEHLPDLSGQISKVKSESPRMEGFRDGRRQFVLDRSRENRQQLFQKGRELPDKGDMSKDKDLEPEH